MWDRTFVLLLHAVQAVVASQCWQGATFSESVVSPAVDSSGVLRVPGVASLPQCVAACCDLPGYDLAWLFEGRCYILSCQQKDNCRPTERPGSDSYLAFLRRASPQTLVLQSLVKGARHSSRWRPPAHSSEAPGDLEALKDLALFDESRQDFPDPGTLDLDYSEGSQERGGGAAEMQTTTDGFNHSEAEDSPTQDGVLSGESVSQRPEDRTRRPADPPPEEEPVGAAGEADVVTTGSADPGSASPSPHKPTAGFQQPEPGTEAAPTSAPPPSSTGGHPVGPLLASLGSPVEPTAPSPDAATSPPSTTVQHRVWTMTSDPSPNAPTTNTRTATAVCAESNRGLQAIVGPDRTLVLPVSSLLLEGSSSRDDRGGVKYHWDAVSGPPGVKLDGQDGAVATVTGLRVGRYTFRLTVTDQEGATDSASLTVRVQEARSLPPVAHASGSHTLTLPNSSLVLRGTVTDGDQTQVHYLWVRDSQSPAAGDALYGSETQQNLYLANLVEGTYLFQLRVTDAQGRPSTSTATVEVRPEPGGGGEVELEMLVSVSQVSVAQRDTVVRQLAALLHVLDGDIQVRALQGHSRLSTVLRFCVRGPSGPLSGPGVVSLLRSQLLREKSDYLLFRALRVDTVVCLLGCSGRGQCDPITKRCSCDPFWTENLIRRYLGDGESNCEWRVLYVILTSFVLMVLILLVSWTFICCCKRRRQTKVRRKTKYTILDNMDEQERVELRPKFSIKHRSTDHNSCLMMSESELDSDQDTSTETDPSAAGTGTTVTALDDGPPTTRIPQGCLHPK